MPTRTCEAPVARSVGRWLALGGAAARPSGGRPLRLAHPHRRNSDQQSTLLRTARTATVGVSMLTIMAWLWRVRIKRRRAHSRHEISDDTPDNSFPPTLIRMRF
jgi:hypothetical protein